MTTYFLSARPPYRGLSGCPLLPTGCPQTPPMDQPFPDTSPLSPVTAEVTLMVLIFPMGIHSLVYPSAYLLPPPPGAEGSTTFSPRLPQTSKWHHSASGGSGQKPRSQSRCFSSHHHPSAIPLVPTQSVSSSSNTYPNSSASCSLLSHLPTASHQRLSRGLLQEVLTWSHCF